MPFPEPIITRSPGGMFLNNILESQTPFDIIKIIFILITWDTYENSLLLSIAGQLNNPQSDNWIREPVDLNSSAPQDNNKTE